MKEIFLRQIKYYFQSQIATQTLIEDSKAQVKNHQTFLKMVSTGTLLTLKSQFKFPFWTPF